MNLKSSVNEKGKKVTQYILFASGNEKTYEGILTESIQQSQFTRFDTVDGRRVYINTEKVDCFEVFSEEPTVYRSNSIDPGILEEIGKGGIIRAEK